MLKKLVLALLLASTGVTAQNITGTVDAVKDSTKDTTTLTMTLDPGQIYSTGNLVQQTTTSTGSTWIGAVYQDNLTCWGPGGQGYCGPSPIVRPGNNINFSYGWSDIYQQVQLSTSSALSVSGLRVNGYNFGFTAKNGNGWDDGRTDNLFAYVQFNDNNGNTLYNRTHNLTQQFGWTNFNYNETFTNPYALTDLSSVRYGFVGSDNNGWAGTYGPEIYNISFSLKYSVDPCATNPMYSPTCPGYIDALNKLLPPASTTATFEAASETIVTAPITPTVVEPIATVVSSSPILQPVVASVVSAPAPVTTSTASNSPTSNTQNSKEPNSGSTSLALSIISKNQERDAAGAVVAQSAVSQAQAAANQAQQEAQSVASNAVANSTTNNSASNNNQSSSGNGIRVNTSSISGMNLALQPGMSSISTTASGQQNNNLMVVQQQTTGSMGVMNSSQALNTSTSTQSTSQVTTEISYALPLLQPTIQITNNVAVTMTSLIEEKPSTLILNSNITRPTEVTSVLPSNFLTDRTNPLTDIVEGKQNIPQNSTTAISGPSVNTNTSDNELASGVSINKMALAPTGYNDYLNFTLRDTSFYSPKEVYKNQKNVDNTRALRQLSSDRKHKDMVEMQYAK